MYPVLNLYGKEQHKTYKPFEQREDQIEIRNIFVQHQDNVFRKKDLPSSIYNQITTR